ncbi:transcriptional regulator, TetR family [Lentzea fradiae]|uniref:Transcriptional regulator, TetR family n=1 Tax=Lentzea fradiae TaxID=200378 RepID=A0A1G7MG97_9PSEU|nr:TetR/AcrR family transcriptional regulator [Lentzea fradiae]SDF60703.1 transcriptional regulator, TetR family [Lentzea fradiae]
MATSTRRARERASIRERIIEAALTVLESEGTAALTVRRIATEVEYTAPIVYQHFANKDALVVELVAHGYRLMLDSARHAAEEPDIELRMVKVGSECVRFAGEHPHLYQIMNSPAVDAEERTRAAQPAIDLLRELIGVWSRTHDVVLADFDDACEIIWGTVYGIASLGFLGTIGNERARHLVEQALRTVLAGWRTGA